MALKILIGDDDMVNQLVVRGLMKKIGHTDCTVVSSGKAVLEAAAAEEFDWLLLDIQLPDMDGFEVARRLPAEAKGGIGPKVVFVSGHDASDFKAEVAEVGAAGFVTKPVSEEALRDVIS